MKPKKTAAARWVLAFASGKEPFTDTELLIDSGDLVVTPDWKIREAGRGRRK